ncbi:MAG: TetR/AcrR family transcriptional regulator [Myxococcales bacterium]|nr:TetR/AcrR family transcriptional regulator [Myxococcales bacterium]
MSRPARYSNEHIVRVALRLLARRGPREFTAQALADELGITPGALFRHFPSMSAIVDAVIESMEARLFSGFPLGDDDPLRCLEKVFRYRIDVIHAHPDVSRLLQSQHLGRAAGKTMARRLAEFKRRSQKFVRDCIRHAAARGELDPRLDPEAAAVIVLGAIHALSHVGVRVVKSRSHGAIVEKVWRVIEDVLRGRRAR